MLYRPLGQTGLTVSEIGLGCASYWGKKQFSHEKAVRIVQAAAERGVTFFDTGASYSGGNAEPRLGAALDHIPNKNDLVVATKVGTHIGNDGKLYKDFSAAAIRRSVEASLTRLGLESIALLQLHGPEIRDLTPEVLTTLTQLKKEGKVRHLGINNFDHDTILHVSTLPEFEVVMIDYNILRPEWEPVIHTLGERRFGILAGMALAGGLYARKHLNFLGLRNMWYAARSWKNNRKEIMRGKQLRYINNVPHRPASEIALAWVLNNPAISCAVFGTTRMENLIQNLRASGNPLPADILAQIAKTHGESPLFRKIG